MFYKEFINRLGGRVGVQNLDDKTIRSYLGGKINDSMKEISRIYDWEHLKKISELRTVANVVGNVTATKDSRVVTGSGFTSAMVGRYIKPLGSSNWYKILAVPSGTTLTLFSPFIEDSVSGVTSTIWKRFYYLHSEVRKLWEFDKWVVNGEIQPRSNYYRKDSIVDISATGEPEDFSVYGVDPLENSYSAGTITLTKDLRTVTGIGTAWLNNVEAGEILTVGNDVYRVKRIESDTSIVLYNFAVSTVISPGKSYTIERDNPFGIQFTPSPNKVYLFPYTYFARVYDMVNEDKDRPPMPEDFDMAILDGAEAAWMRDKDDAKWERKQSEYIGRVKDLKARGFAAKPKHTQLKPDIENRGGR